VPSCFRTKICAETHTIEGKQVSGRLETSRDDLRMFRVWIWGSFDQFLRVEALHQPQTKQMKILASLADKSLR
jgi:hypothetical protein